MSAVKYKTFFKVFSQYIPCKISTKYFAHYYPISAIKKPNPKATTLGSIVSVFQYTNTAEEAASLMASMFHYSKNKLFLSLPKDPIFNNGQQSLF